MDILALGLFVFILTACIIWNVSIITALLLGYVLFFLYGLYRKISQANLVCLSWKGISTVSTIIIMFFLIGMAAPVPWSTDVLVPCTTAGAPFLSVTAACYLYLQPVWSFFIC